MSYQLFSSEKKKQKTKLQWLKDNDYNAERSKAVTRDIRANLEAYK